MAIYVNVNGTWTPVVRPYVRKAGVWAPAMGVFSRTSGAWQQPFEYDVTPPSAPELTLTVETNSSGGAYILVGVRQPQTANDKDVAMIRVLVGKSGSSPSNPYPSSPTGATYISGSTDGYPHEPWSDYHYNDYKPYAHADTSVVIRKKYPLNQPSSGDLAAGTYRFAAWTRDFDGNWSVATRQSIVVPKKGDPKTIAKSARFDAAESGYYLKNAWHAGDLLVQGMPGVPSANGWYFYGNRISESIGQNGTPTIKSAQILLHRTNDDGVANANIYLQRSAVGAPSASQPDTTGSQVFVGTLAKGQSKWFDIPTAWYGDLNKQTGAILLNHKSPDKAQANGDDYLIAEGIDTRTGVIRPGELYVVWSES